MAAGARGGVADRVERPRVRLVRAVREVQAEDVDAGGDQRVEHARATLLAGPSVATILV